MAIYQEASLKAEYLTAKKEAVSRGTQRITSWEAMKHALECVPLLATTDMVRVLVDRPEVVDALPHSHAQLLITVQMEAELSGIPELTALMHALNGTHIPELDQQTLMDHAIRYTGKVPEEQRYRAYLVAAATFVYLHQS